jgi:hypothetical protein
MSDRASVFDAVQEFDVEGFAPKAPQTPAPSPPPDAVRAAAEASSFRSREPAPARTTRARREPRRYRTGRSVQLNLKVRAETVDTFYEIADEHGWILAETLEKALEALQRDLSAAPSSARPRMAPLPEEGR